MNRPQTRATGTSECQRRNRASTLHGYVDQSATQRTCARLPGTRRGDRLRDRARPRLQSRGRPMGERKADHDRPSRLPWTRTTSTPNSKPPRSVGQHARRIRRRQGRAPLGQPPQHVKPQTSNSSANAIMTAADRRTISNQGRATSGHLESFDRQECALKSCHSWGRGRLIAFGAKRGAKTFPFLSNRARCSIRRVSQKSSSI